MRSMLVARPATRNENPRLLPNVPQSGLPRVFAPVTRKLMRKNEGMRMMKMRNEKEAKSRTFGAVPRLNLRSGPGQTRFKGNRTFKATSFTV